MGSTTSGAKFGAIVPISMDFSTSASKGTTLADGVGLGRDEAEVAGIPHPSTATDAEGMLPATSEAETSELATLPAEAWPCCLSAFFGASGGVSD